MIFYILLRNIIIKNGIYILFMFCLYFFIFFLCFVHALLTLCLHFVHALLTLCTRFAHALGSFLSPYKIPFGSLWGFAHGLLTVCSLFAHDLLALLILCSCFAHDNIFILIKKSKNKLCLFLLLRVMYT
jgi:hypothetical protein